MYNEESTCNIPTTKKLGGRGKYWISSTVGDRGESQRESHIHTLHLRRVIETLKNVSARGVHSDTKSLALQSAQHFDSINS